MIKDKFTQAQIDSLQQISMAAERGANLTRQLLTFSRRQVIQPKFVDLSEIVSDMAKLIKTSFGRNDY
jgi:C4-dicarboxylate-specific signal transduction histidine kinase